MLSFSYVDRLSSAKHEEKGLGLAANLKTCVHIRLITGHALIHNCLFLSNQVLGLLARTFYVKECEILDFIDTGQKYLVTSNLSNG